MFRDSEGEYRVDAEVVYEGAFCDGMMHGDGRLLFENGEIWEGQLWKVMARSGQVSLVFGLSVCCVAVLEFLHSKRSNVLD